MRSLSRVCPLPGVKLRVSRRNGPRRNSQNGVEGIHRIETTVEAEHEFIEVGLQMTRFDPAMVGAIDPRLQIGKDKMDHWQVLFRLLWVAAERENIVLITYPAKVIISLPAISADDRAVRHIFRDESSKRLNVATGGRSNYLFHAGNDAEPKAPSISEFLGRNATVMSIFPFHFAIIRILARPNFNSANYRCLMMNSSSFATRAPDNATFVYFDRVRRADSIAVWPNHTGAELVKHSECRLIRGNIKLALKLDGGLAGRLCCHEISAPKPRRERHMTRLHNRPGSEGRVLFASTAAQHNRRTGCETIRLTDVPALRASEAVRPAHRL